MDIPVLPVSFNKTDQWHLNDEIPSASSGYAPPFTRQVWLRYQLSEVSICNKCFLLKQVNSRSPREPQSTSRSDFGYLPYSASRTRRKLAKRGRPTGVRSR